MNIWDTKATDKVQVTDTLSLEGNTLGERHKYLNILVKRAPDDVLSPNNLINLHLKSQIELVFIAKVANRKKHPRILCELFKSEYPTVVHTALCAKWLFKGTTHEDYCNASHFSKKIFPFVSYHTTCRIIANLGAYLRDKVIADEFFKVIKDSYGLKLAYKILPACSIDCIKTQLKIKSNSVPCAILYKIYFRDYKLVTNYLEEYVKNYFDIKMKMSKHSPYMNYDKVFKRIALDYPDIFMKIIEDYPHACSEKEIAGKRTTKKILKLMSGRVVTSAKSIQYSINNKVVVNTLKGNALEQYVLGTLPDSYDDFPFTLVLNRLKEKQRVLISYKLHPLKYNGESLLDRENYWSSLQMRHIPKGDRIAWAENKMNNLDVASQRQYYKYLEPRVGAKLLMRQNEDKEKTFDALKDMADLFVINGQELGLIRIIRQVSDTLKRDPNEVGNCLGFLYHVKQSYNIYKVSRNLWSIITQLIENLSQTNNITSTQRLSMISYMCDQLRFHVHHNVPFDQIIQKIFQMYKSEFWHLYILDLVMSFRTPEHKLKFIRKFVENLRRVLNENANKYELWRNVMFLIKLYTEVKKYVGVSFTEWDWLVILILVNLQHWSFNQNRDLMIEINKDWKGRRMFFKEIFKYTYDNSILHWLLNNNVDSIASNLGKFCEYFTQDFIPIHSKERKNYDFKYDSAIFIRCIMRSWDDFKVPTEPFPYVAPVKSFFKRFKIINKINVYFYNTINFRLVKYLSEKIRNDFNDFTKQRALQIVFLCSLLAFIEGKSYIEANVPSKTGLANHPVFYETLMMTLKYVSPRISYGTLMKFLDHGRLNIVQSSVYSIVSKKSCNDTRMFVTDLMKESVVTRKMGIHLSFVACLRRELLKCYTDTWNQNMNTQIRMVIFKKVFKLMLDEDKDQSCLEIWNTLKYFIGGMTVTDVRFLKYIRHSDKVALMPSIFTNYCDSTFQLFKNVRISPNLIQPYKKMLIESICKNASVLDEKFLETHTLEFRKYVEKFDTDNVYEFLPLVISYLMLNKEHQTENSRLIIVCKAFSNSGCRLQKTLIDKTCLYEEYLKDFIIELCSSSMNQLSKASQTNVTICQTMLVDKVQSANVEFKCYITLFVHLTLTYISQCITDSQEYKKCLKLHSYSSEINKQVGKSFGEMVNKFHEDNGMKNFLLYSEILKLWMSHLCINKPQHVHFDIMMSIVEGFYNDIKNQENFVIVETLLPKELSKGSKYKSLYMNIVSIINISKP